MYRAVLIALLMSLFMTTLSAYIRLSDSGIGCQNWPACYLGEKRIDEDPGIKITSEDSHKTLRVTHRLTASVFGFLILILMLVSIRHRKSSEAGVAESVIAFLLMLILSLVGMRTPDIVHPIVTFMNLSGGMLLSAILFWWLLKISTPSLRFWRGSALSIATAAVVFLTISLGAWVSGNFAASACDSMLVCDGLGEGSFKEAFAVDRSLTLTAGRLVEDGNGPLIGFMHHLASVAASILILWLGYSIYRSNKDQEPGITGPVTSALIVIIVLVLLMLQGLSGLVEGSLVIATIHNLLSVILLLSVLNLSRDGSNI